MLTEELVKCGRHWETVVSMLWNMVDASGAFRGGGAGVARVLLRTIPSVKNLRGTARLAKISEEFGIEKLSSDSVGIGQGRVELTRLPEELFPRIRVIAGRGRTQPSRRRSVVAHELGHVFCAAVWEIQAKRGGVPPKSYRDQENWCWDFGLELLCPVCRRRAWQAAELKAMRDPFQSPNQQTQVTLTLGRVFSLSREWGLSVRNLIRGLHRMPVLSETQESVAILEVTPNRRTRTIPALRTTMTAMENGFFLPTNQRSAHHGFSHAAEVYDHGEEKQYAVRQEQVIMKLRDPTTGRWSAAPQAFRCECVYIPWPTRGKKYLFVTWGRLHEPANPRHGLPPSVNYEVKQ